MIVGVLGSIGVYHVPLALLCIYGSSEEGVENRGGEEGMRFQEEGRFPGLLYVDDLILFGKSKENLREIVRRFVEVCKGRGLKVNAGISKIMCMCVYVCVCFAYFLY